MDYAFYLKCLKGKTTNGSFHQNNSLDIFKTKFEGQNSKKSEKPGGLVYHYCFGSIATSKQK